MKRLLFAMLPVLVAAPAWAGAAIKTNTVPFVDYCDGVCRYNGGACSTDADCEFGSLSAKSKFTLAADGTLKVQLKGVVDSTLANASGDYMLYVVVTWHDQGNSYGESVGIKVPVTNGKGKTEADISGLIVNADEVFLGYARLITPPLVPANCPGTGNTTAEIVARGGDPDCFSGDGIGLAGIVGGTKTAFKAQVSPVPDACEGANCNRTGDMCTTNADCDVGATSPKSKFSLTGEGRLKVKLSGVVDADGADASGDYMLFFVVADTPYYVVTEMMVKVAVDGGTGKLDTDLSTLLTPGRSYGVEGYLLTPPTSPVDCPTPGNTAAEVVARAMDPDCWTGDRIAQIGLQPE